MTTWPTTISTPEGMTEKTIKPQFLATSESGHVVVRPRGTAPKKEFKLSWRLMTQEDKETTEAFFDANRGLSFDWTHPADAEVYTVFFKDKEGITFKYETVGWWETSFELREV